MGELSNAAGITAERIDLMECPDCDSQLDISGNEVLMDFVCPACSNVITTPGRFGDFILVRKLGAGGMGAVFLAIDEKLGREVALKITRKEFGANPKFLERFANEAQAMARFNHPNVVQIYTYGSEYGQPFMVTEYVTGGSLADQMEDGEGLDQAAILEVARDLAAGLQAAQDNGLVHGDIKPDNIMFDDRGNAKIMDFGLAKFATEDGEKPKEVWGTPFYIAPEKARKKGEDYQSDQYSLGATLYHAMAGEPPFDGATPTEVVVARLKADATPLHRVNPYISKKTAKIISRMMSRSPSTRYPTYASMQSDLNAAIGHAQSNPGPYDYSEGGSDEPEAKKKSPIFPIILGIGILLGLALTVLALTGGGDKGNDKPKVPTVEERRKGGLQDEITSQKVTDLKPFTTIRTKAMLTAGKNYPKPGGFTAAESGIRRVRDRMKGDEIGAQWATLMLGMSAMAGTSPQSSRVAFDELTTAKDMQISYKATNGRPPRCDPRDFAKMLLGKGMDIPTFTTASRGYKPKFKEFADFAKGLRQMRDGYFAEAAKNFDAYSKLTPEKNDWMLAMVPLAKFLKPRAAKAAAEVAKSSHKPRAARVSDLQALINNTTDPRVKKGLERLLKRIN